MRLGLGVVVLCWLVLVGPVAFLGVAASGLEGWSFLISWIGVGAAGLYAFVGTFAPRLVIQVNSRCLRVYPKPPFVIGFYRRYLSSGIHNLRVAPGPSSVVPAPICFSYDDKPVQIVSGLSRENVEKILSLIQERYPQYRNVKETEGTRGKPQSSC